MLFSWSGGATKKALVLVLKICKGVTLVLVFKQVLFTSLQCWRLMQIIMPSGMVVTAKYACFKKDDDCYLDVTVYPLAEDFGHAQGLCGDFDGKKDNDLVPKGSTVNEDSKEPIKFVTSYMSVLPCCAISQRRHRLR